MADEGAVGDVYLVKQGEKHDGPHTPWFYDVQRSGGGALMDLGCHGIEWARWMYGKPKVKSVYAHLQRVHHKKPRRAMTTPCASSNLKEEPSA